MHEHPLLDQIHSPEDLRSLSESQLGRVSEELREYLIETVSNVGGHFASSLGVVELTVALHYLLNTPEDKIIWDTGHQTYPHKILTGRREALKRVRQYGGISGFPKRDESTYDTYNTGHAGTAISQMLGEAVARDLLGKQYKTVAVVGDASIASGNSFEALNHGGHIKNDCLVILNDNDMAISSNVGALNSYLNRMITSPTYNWWRKLWYAFLIWTPVIGPALRLFSRKVEKSTKDFFTPGSLFSDFGFRYVGPVNGHDIGELVIVLRKALEMKGPVLLHVLTKKGYGYEPAMRNPIKFHSVTEFNRHDGSPINNNKHNRIGFSEIVGETLTEIATRNRKVVAVTPAMIEGSGLRGLYEKFPDRVIDVGIAEQHATAFSGALASAGVIPYLCIYSTFLTRAVSQFIQDVALMKLPVRIVIDRAGCVGPDGETHQGLFDLGLLLSVPNVKIYAPARGEELKAFILYMENFNEGPIAVRFPKASAERDKLVTDRLPDISSIRPVTYGTGRDMAILAIGAMYDTALEVEESLRNMGIRSIVVGIRWIRPLDLDYLVQILNKTERFIMIEDSYASASASNYIMNQLPPYIRQKHQQTFAFPEKFITHGTIEQVRNHYGLSPDAIVNSIMKDPAYKSFISVNASVSGE